MKNKQSRYERVRAILNSASEGSSADYDGYGRFWERPLDEFLELSIYGVRMIAPPSGAATDTSDEGGGTCCGGSGSDSPAPSDPTRGPRSGLIIGLRGQPPFDGSQFPRLPWGGKPVSDADIDFISDWINDGCPAEDDEPKAAASKIDVAESEVSARACGDAEHPLCDHPTNVFSEETGGLKARKNIACLSDDELANLRNAIAEMRKLDEFINDERSFNFWGRIHANSCQHGWEEFLPWHRAYLYEFEQRLQDIDSTVTLPYWHWSQYGEDVGISIIDSSAKEAMDNGVIPKPYRCFVDDGVITELEAELEKPDPVVTRTTVNKLKKIKGELYGSGNRLFSAAGITYGKDRASDDAIMNALLHANPLWHRFRWPGGDADLIFQTYPTPGDIERILQIGNFYNFGSGPANNHFFGALENIHNLLHNFSGGANPYFPEYAKINADNPIATSGQDRVEPQNGDMVDPGVTAYDPIFWGHHSNVDRLWAEWQKRHPGVGPDNSTAILPPWTLNVGQMASTQNLGYEYVNCSHLYRTETSVPMTKFRSAATEVSDFVMQTHKSAEVRLHGVRYMPRGATVRVFINQPDANEKTPMEGNDHYVGQIHTFMGACIGGPGHCEPPPVRKRPFDLRHRHHKTPGNYHLDATETVRKLSEQGAKKFEVDYVVLGMDGKILDGAMKMAGVSLNFMD